MNMISRSTSNNRPPRAYIASMLLRQRRGRRRRGLGARGWDAGVSASWSAKVWNGAGSAVRSPEGPPAGARQRSKSTAVVLAPHSSTATRSSFAGR
jgi:hypothetical protein